LGDDKEDIHFTGKEQGCNSHPKPDVVGPRADGKGFTDRCRLGREQEITRQVHCGINDEGDDGIQSYQIRISKYGRPVTGRDNNKNSAEPDQGEKGIVPA